MEQQRSLGDIASAIKINRRHLEAIEAGDLSQLPQGPYVAAFVREYARALGLVVPPEYAPLHAPIAASPRDPKVVSHPAHPSEEGGLSQMARDTARFANTAVKEAVKTVTKTTESVVNLVETGSKEAFEVLTSKELWEEAENIRRERHGLPPLERQPEQASPAARPQPKNIVEPPSSVETVPSNAASAEAGIARPEPAKVVPARRSRHATNIVIVMLAILFAGVAYLAIRMSRTQGGAAIPSRDYVPAPLEKQPPRAVRKPTPPTPAPAVAAAAPAVTDSLQFQLRATQPVWVSIAPDGIPAYRGQMRAGEVRSFRAAQKFVVDIGNQKSVSMTLDGTPLSRLPAIQNSNVVVRNLVLMRDGVMIAGNSVDLHKLSTPPPTPEPASSPKVVTGVPPPAIATHLEDLAKKAKLLAAQKAKARQSAAKNHSSASSSARTKQRKQSRKGVSIPTEPIHPVQPIPPTP